MSPLPTLNKVFSLIIQQERQLSAKIGDVAKVFLNAASQDLVSGSGNSNVSQRNFSGAGSPQGGRKQCTHYGKYGHTIDQCYKKHGFPTCFKFKNQKSANVLTTDSAEGDTVTHTQEQVNQEPRFDFIAD